MNMPEMWAVLGLAAIIAWAVRGRRCESGFLGRRERRRRREAESEIGVKDQQIDELKKRVEVLERIVTDRRENLKDEFRGMA